MIELSPRLYERFWSNVDREGGEMGPFGSRCWLWTGWKTPTGYGRFKADVWSSVAHRVTFQLLVGPIPEGLELDHLCRVRGCVNPVHLEPVTHAENVRRGRAGIVGGARQRAKTHCPQGHPYDEANTYIGRLGRSCRACGRASYHRRKARLNAKQAP